MEAVSIRNHPPLCLVVAEVLTHIPRFDRNDGGARSEDISHHDYEMGS